MTSEVEHPTFDPAYVPTPGKSNSISVRCVDEDTMHVWNSRWDHGTSWMAVQDTTTGEWVIPQQEWAYGVGHDLPHRPGFVLHYWSGEEYTYAIVPGRCSVEQPATTTTNPPSTTTTVPEPTTSTTEQPTTTTAPPVEETATTTTEATVQGTSTSVLSPLPELNCEYFRQNNLPVPAEPRYDTDGDGLYCEIGTLQPTGLDTTNARTQHPTTGADPMTTVLLGSVLVLIGFVASAPALFNKWTRWRNRAAGNNAV